MKKISKLLCMLLTLALLCTLLPAAALADSSGRCGLFAAWSLSADGTLTVSGKGDMFDYGTNNTPWVREGLADSVKAVVVSDGITKLGSCAFYGCGSLVSASLGSTVKTVGAYAFAETGLESIALPDSVSAIGKAAFYNCTALKSAILPSSLAEISSVCFDGCTALETVALPAALKTVGEGAFYGCTALKAVTLPDSVTTVGKAAFYACESLAELVIGNGVSSVGEGAFYKCPSLVNVVIGDKVPNLDEFYFAENAKLESVTLGKSINAIPELYFSACTALRSIDLSSVSAVGRGAFNGCTSLASVKLGSIAEIPELCFYGDTALSSLSFSEGTETVAANAFYGCTALSSVTFPASLKSIGSTAFYGCTALTEIVIPSGVKSIGYGAFYGCEAAAAVRLGAGVTSIGESAFGSCSAVTDVYYGGTAEQWSAVAVGEGNSCLTKANLHCTDASHVHSFVSAVVAPTCTDKGYTYYKCECGEVYADSYVPALGHNYVDGVCTRCGAKEAGGAVFADVSESAVYYDAVMWAYNHKPQITSGVYANEGGVYFCPDYYCTRGQAVTFLWRAAGCPTPSGTENPFTDIDNSSPFYTAVLWAVENNITGGYGNGLFGTNDRVTRAQFVTFLWRAVGCPTAEAVSFTDTAGLNSDFVSAIGWAASNGIAAGYDDGSFHPSDTCKRLHVVMFLSRCYD